MYVESERGARRVLACTRCPRRVALERGEFTVLSKGSFATPHSWSTVSADVSLDVTGVRL